FYFVLLLVGVLNKLCTANGKSALRARYEPLTNKSAPASQHFCAVSAFIPPSTEIRYFHPYFLRVAAKIDILCILDSLNSWPAAPGVTVIIITSSLSRSIGFNISTDDSGFSATPARRPAPRIRRRAARTPDVFVDTMIVFAPAAIASAD